MLSHIASAEWHNSIYAEGDNELLLHKYGELTMEKSKSLRLSLLIVSLPLKYVWEISKYTETGFRIHLVVLLVFLLDI